MRGPGYLVLPAALPRTLSEALLRRSRAVSAGELRPAAVGRELGRRTDAAVRGDLIHWVRAEEPADGAYLTWMEGLRLALNRQLFLGLFDYECHYACYPPGAFYRTHLDAFRGAAGRLVSTVLYLNPRWRDRDRGELVLHDPQCPHHVLARVRPAQGTLVAFLSASFPHQVLPTRRPRYSLAGWFRRNGSTGNRVDPPC